MPNKLPKFLDNHKICIICEGNEEYEYLKRLKDLKVWNEQYDISLVNAGGNGNIPARYQDRYQNGADELVLVFCDTEKKPHEQYEDIKRKINEFHGVDNAADEVIITVNPQLLAMMGLQDFLKTVKKIKSRINYKLDVAGILLTMCDARTNLCKVITEQVIDTFEGQIRIFDSKIPNTVKVGESVYYSEPLLEYAPDCKACEAYENLAKELIVYEG